MSSFSGTFFTSGNTESHTRQQEQKREALETLNKFLREDMKIDTSLSTGQLLCQQAERYCRLSLKNIAGKDDDARIKELLTMHHKGSEGRNVSAQEVHAMVGMLKQFALENKAMVEKHFTTLESGTGIGGSNR